MLPYVSSNSNAYLYCVVTAKDEAECSSGKFSCGYKNDNGTHHCIKYELVCNKVHTFIRPPFV